MRDTVKQVGPDGMIERTVDRALLWLAQTPQAFRRDWIEEAHRKAHAEGVRATDDAFLVEWLGHAVAVVQGSGENIKVTRPEDLVVARPFWPHVKQVGKLESFSGCHIETVGHATFRRLILFS